MFTESRSGLRRITHGALCLILLGSAAVAHTNRIKGTVVDPTGGAVAGARITLVGRSGSAPHNTLTDELGNISVNAPGAGTYTLKVDKDRFEPAAEKVTVSESQTGPLRITLRLQSLRQSVTVNDTGLYYR